MLGQGAPELDPGVPKHTKPPTRRVERETHALGHTQTLEHALGHLRVG